jgi:hypothetical protein
MDMSRDHIDFEPQIPFLGSEDLFSPFCAILTPKIIFLLAPCKVFDRIWGLKSVWSRDISTILILDPKFRLWALKAYVHLFDLQKFFFLAPFKILDRRMHHTTILIMGLKFRFWALKTYLHLLTPKSIFFLA